MSPDRALRVAVVHGYYSNRMPSGENVVVDLQVAALRAAGHTVEVFARHQEEVERARTYPVQATLRAATGHGYDPADAIDAFGPDVVHVHNLFPNFGRTWVRRYAGRLVATLHNYRPICPAATLYRDGAGCTLCPDGRSARPAVRYACYKDSRIATVPVALGTRFAADPLLAAADRVVTLNDDMRGHYEAVGVPAERLVTVPNFVSDAGVPGRHGGGFWLFVGRFSEEKGILPLVRRWPEGHRLLLVGSGPLEDAIRSAGVAGVELLGQVPNAEVRRLLGEATGLVFPSLWPEGLPTIYLEALAAGTPVLASPESIVGSLVADEGTGLVSTGAVADDLARAAAAFPSLQERCRASYEARYTESAWVAAIERVYRGLPA
jgi:glycosyltransferase involved in cell wall biosynthesis